jgi:hypothetical protein
MKWYKNPMFVFVLGLTLFSAGALLYNLRPPVFALLVSVALGAAIAYLGLKYLQPKGHWAGNTLVSGLIAFLLLNPALSVNFESMAWAFLGGVLVVLAKLGPKYKRQVIFNPAALGLIILSGLLTLVYGTDALLPTFVSWWGTDYAGLWALVILAPLVSFAAYKFRKLYLVISFLVFNAIWLYVNGGFQALVYPYTTGALYFMAGIMLLEPKTSPIKKSWQIAAAFAALIAYRYAEVIGLHNVELWAIMAVNLVHLLSRLPLIKFVRNLKLKNV